MLLALLAPIVSACGGSGSSGPDTDARRLPRTLDLDQVAGMRIPGSPHCKFEAESRTFLRGARGSAQDLLFTCGSAPHSGNVRTLSGAAERTIPQQMRCRREEKGDRTVMCLVRHDRLLVGSDAHCIDPDPDSYCLDDWARIEGKARAAITRVIELLELLAEGATPASEIDPAALPATMVDPNRLAGRSTPGKPFDGCAFDDDPRDATIGLRCGSSTIGTVGLNAASAEAISRADPGTPDDIVVCSRGARKSDCYLRHGTARLSTTVDCPGSCRDGATPSALMALVAQLLASP
ncbi:MAG: hypothetical protein ABW060_00405 [Solirubrobacteraceae bacterium]